MRNYGMGGLLWGKVNEDAITGPLGKAVTDRETFLSTTGAGVGDLVLIGAGDAGVVNPGMGRLRVHVAGERGMIPEGIYRLVWIVDFPLFERDGDQLTSVHHPFTSPVPEHVDRLGTDEAHTILSDAYDLVCNGLEMGGGSIRIHRADIQERVFSDLGDWRRGAAGEVWLAAGCLGARRATARWHRLWTRPYGHDPHRSDLDSRRHRLSQDHQRAVPACGRTESRTG